MAKPGELVRLTDLEDPWLPWPVRALNGALRPFAARAFPFEPEGLMAEARRRTGLSRFGDPRFRDGLEVLCRALDEEARLSAFGRFASRSLLVQVWLRQGERREALAFYQRRFGVRDEPLES